MSYTAGDLAQSKLLSCAPDTSVSEAAKMIVANKCSSILVKENNRIVGIWTEADCSQLTNHQLNQNAHICNFMSSPVVSVDKSTSIEELIISFYQHKIRHLLVTSQGQPIGIVSQSDVIRKRGIEHLLRSRQIKESYNRQSPIELDGELTFEKICKQMNRNRGTSVLIRNNETNEVGILTERDLLRLVAIKHEDSDIWRFCSHPLIQLNHRCTLLEAFNVLKSNAIRHIVIADDESQVLGVLSFKDIFAGIEFAHFNELQSTIIRREHALKKSQKNLVLAERIIAASVDGIMIANQDNEIVSVNPAFSSITGYEAHEVIGKKTSILSSGMHNGDFYGQMWQAINEKGQWQGEIWNKRKNDEVYPEWLTIIRISEMHDEDVHYAAIFSDITERKKGEEQIHALAYYDELTKLPNRSLFNEQLTSALATQTSHFVAVLFIDLDRFKQINDTLGHKVGDELLVLTARRISSCVKDSDVVSRLGGDEFVVLLNHLESEEVVENVMQRIVEALSRPFLLAGRELVVTCSVGASVSTESGDNSELMLKHADLAMYEAKTLGRNTHQLFKAEMNHKAAQRLALENHLRAALVNEEFELNYQLQFDNKSNNYKGLEALLRWNNSILGRVPPSEFIPVAEEIGLIVEIERWVLKKACQQRKLWLEDNVDCGKLSVNISAKHFTKDLFTSVLETLNQTKLPPQYLEIEVTESCFISQFESVRATLQSLANLGVSISLDDFGTGYSSLSYLSQLPLDAIKIDASFIANVPNNERDCRLVISIISMAESLGLETVAEGVENKEQEAFLANNGCHVLQGYLYSIPASDIRHKFKHLNATA